MTRVATWRRWPAAAMVAVLGTSALTAAPAAPASAAPAGPSVAPLPVEKPDTRGVAVEGVKPVTRPTPSLAVPAPVWPKPGTTRMKTVAAAGARAAAGSSLAEVDVTVHDRAQVPAAWRDGVVLSVAAPAPAGAARAAAPGGPATIAVDYKPFAHAYGADWASRLRLWKLPACALSTPDAAGCQAEPVPSTNDAKAGQVTAQVQIPAAAPGLRAAAAGGATFALAAGDTGEAGDLAATPLANSGSWTSGGNTGDFSWSYPLRTPTAQAGPAPTLAVSYSSGSVDGRSDATNNQPSWLGEGFELGAGFIERRYVSCGEDDEKSEKDKKGEPNQPKFTDDQCWRSYNATMSLDGGGGELIPLNADATKYRSRSDSGFVIERLTGESNGTDGDEYWKVTSTDGTQYFFGRHNLPGHTAKTNSAWTVPVYGNHPGEPCHAKEFKDSDCRQAWRWNLDYVVDLRGNTMSFWYETESNKYSTRATSTETLSYDRAGTLRRIDYGTWDRKNAKGEVDRSVLPSAQVEFSTGDRCKEDCGKHDEAHWPDVPWDRECKADAKNCEQKFSPTFWSTKRLRSVTTRVWDTTRKTPDWQDVERWDFAQDYPKSGDGTHRGLWLASIKHTGLVGGTRSMPPVSFVPEPKANRVLTDHNTTVNWQRLSQIKTEAGGQIHVTYSLADCKAGDLPSSAVNNQRRCYPVRSPDPQNPDTDRTEWWHRYVVDSVTENDVQLANGQQMSPKNTKYVYEGAPAWRYADDDGLDKPKRRTWNQWRGYKSVLTVVGDSTDTTRTRTTYLRGMHGDRIDDKTRRDITVPASLGAEKVYDEDQFAGMVRETVVYNGGDDKPISKTVNVPWRSSPTATRTINGDTAEARFVNTQTVYSATALGENGERGWRTSRTRTTFDDDYGTATAVDETGDMDKSGDEKCVTTAYHRNTARNIVVLPKLVTTTALPCGTAPTSPDHMLGVARTTYDRSDKVPPTLGAATLVEQMKDWKPGSGATFQRVAETEYDPSGRPIAVTDQRGNITRTAYSPAGRGTTAKTVATSPKGWTTTTEISPAWNQATKVTDPNKRVTETAYDPLGRVRAQWDGRWTRAQNPDKPSLRYTYCYQPDPDDDPACHKTDKNGYSYLKTETLHAAGGYKSSYTIYDGLLRPRQTQSSTPNPGERVVSDTLYDKWGRADRVYAAHAEAGDPSGVLFFKPQWSHKAVTQTLYDRANRATTTILLATDGVENLVEKWRSTTRHAGDRTVFTPPPGGTPSTIVVDARGNTVELRQHITDKGVDGAFQSTFYEFSPKNLLQSVVDPLKNRWSYTYDMAGRQKTLTDPDRGTTYTEYDEFGDLKLTRNANGKVLAYDYDDVGRKIGMYDGEVAAGKERALWKYDELPSGKPLKGQLTASTRIDAAGNRYTVETASVNDRYQPLAVDVQLPPSAGFGTTWRTEYGYSDYDGSPTSVLLPAVGSMPQEQLTTKYDTFSGLPVSLETLADDKTYVTRQDYNSYGEPTKSVRKTESGQRWEEIFGYDLTTRRLSNVRVTNGTLTTAVTDRSYSYDDAGNITSIADRPTSGVYDTQCFRYDSLRRLTSAWTPKSTAAATPTGNADCAAAPSMTTIDGPGAYWNDWTFDAIGNRTGQQIRTKTGQAEQKYTVPPSGEKSVRPHSLTGVETTTVGGSVTTKAYAYDDGGNMIRRPGPAGAEQILTWDAEDRLTTVQEGAGTVTNLYDADGNRLIRTDPDGATLYLAGTEIRKTGAGLSGTRYYDFAGRTVATRNSADRKLTWTFDDHQGTQLLTIDNASLAVAIRRQDPYGVPRGQNPATWATAQGFVGGDNDPTGLTHLGARDYDPGLGRFLSVDPVHDLSDPQQWNPYAYANNTPISMADPTGLYGSWCATALCAEQTADVNGCPGCTYDDDDSGGGGNDGGGNSSGVTPYIPVHTNLVIAGNNKNANKYKQYWEDFLKRADPVGDDPREQAVWALNGFASECGSHGPDVCKVDLDTIYDLTHRIITGDRIENYVVIISGDQISNRWNPSDMVDAALYLPLEAGPGSRPPTAADSAAIVTTVHRAIVGSNTAGGGGCSFSGDTEVLLDPVTGDTAPIAELAVGDRVWAEDPVTGEFGLREVVPLVHDDTLVDLVVAGSRLTTTEDHPFWNETDGEWQRADRLDRGDLLRAPEGRTVAVGGLLGEARIGAAYNLSVAGLHTYFVVVGGTPVLVHNKCPDLVPYGPKMNYKANPKHANGVLGSEIGPEPKQGQKMLDQSWLVNSVSGRRVAYDRDNGEIVIIPKTGGATYHGYVTLWSNTPEDVKSVLKKQGVFNNRGKLMKGWK